MKKIALRTMCSVAVLLGGSISMAAGPETVSGPGAEPECFKPLTAETQYFKWPAKPGPYRIALVNGFIANDWRVQMIKVAKAYAEQPEVAKDIKEFKVISVGEDIAAQIAAANNFIDQGFDAIIVNANNSSAFGGVVRKANEAGVVVLSFDNVIDDPMNVKINVDQKGLGRTAGEVVLRAGLRECLARVIDGGSGITSGLRDGCPVDGDVCRQAAQLLGRCRTHTGRID